MKRLVLFSAVVMLLLQACTMKAPSLHWEQFDPGHIDKRLSRKNAHHRYLVIFWKNAKGSYTSDALNDFVQKKHWDPDNDGDKGQAAMDWFSDLYQRTTRSKGENKQADTTLSFDKGTLYVYTYITSTWIPGKSKITKSCIWVSADENNMCVLTLPGYAYFYRRRYE